jgi:hypothetical protein
VYAAEVVVTTNGMTESGTQHFAVDGDEVWNFPHACPHPGTSSGTGVA